MSDKIPKIVTKKQVITYLRTPYLSLFMRSMDRKLYSDISIWCNPLANAWRVLQRNQPLFLTYNFNLVVDMVLANSSGDWRYYIAESHGEIHRPTSWTNIKYLLRSNYHLIYRAPEFDISDSVYVYRKANGWDFSIRNPVDYVHLKNLNEVMGNIRRLSEKYCLSAPDWCYKD